VGPILRACELLKAFRTPGEALALSELVSRTRLNKTTVFRAAQSLVAGGLLERVAGERYRSRLAPIPPREFRIGYAAMSSTSLFSREISDSLRQAAVSHGIELVELDNQLSQRVAVRNSERLVQDQVRLAIEFQVHEKIAPVIASNFSRAGIPTIAIHTPHPGAVYFGGNNYLAGRIAGRTLARWAIDNWGGKVDSVLLLGHAAAGPLTNSRLTGTAVTIKHTLSKLNSADMINLDVKGGFAESMEMVLKHLSRSRVARTLVGCVNDSVALGALRAFAETGRTEECAIIGQNGTIAARAELRQPHSRLIGSVGFFPEKYGEHLVTLALDILQGKQVPPAVFMKHTLITRENVNDYYPNDALVVPPAPDSLLFNRYH
jgi:ribose transport system substrate-binding protein